jgi:glycosyltransferase involved in cell wall biosynthesis
MTSQLAVRQGSPPELPATARPAPLRVAIVVNSLDVGGLEKVALELVHSLQRAGHDPHLICIDGAGKMFPELRLAPEKVLVLKKRLRKIIKWSFDTSMPFEIRRFLTDRRIQLLHAHNLGPLVYAGVSGRLLWPRVPVVYSEHNQIYSASPAVRRRFAYYVRLADHVIAVSHDLERELVQVVRTKTPVTVVHNGIKAPAVTEEERREVRASLGVQDDFVIGMVAVLSRQKGIPYLLQAAARVIGERPDVRFLIVGDGPLRADLERQRDELGLAGRVIFTGYRADIPRVMATFDMYVQSSLWEGLPIVLLEALSAGKPIVATTVGGNPEVVEHEVNGLLVPPGDADALAAALLRVAGDDRFRSAASRRNREKFTARFAAEAMLDAHVKLYSALVGKGA